MSTMTRPTPDYYELLDIEPTASADQIKAAYRKLSKSAHPDAGGNSGLFRLIDQAQATLLDPSRRAAYDRSRNEPAPPRSEPKPPPRPADDGWRVEEEPRAYSKRDAPPWMRTPEGWINRLRWRMGEALPMGLDPSPIRELALPGLAYGAGAGSAVAARIEVVSAITHRWPTSVPILLHPQWWWIPPVGAIAALIGVPLSRGMALRPWSSQVTLLGGTWVAIAAGEYVIFAAMVLLMVGLMLRYMVRR